MEQLTGIDAGFLYMETPTLHMHTLKLAILDPTSVSGSYDFERFKTVLEDRLHLLPPFRRRLVEVPYGVSHPLWIEDPDFEIDDHVRHVTLPQPGGRRELAAAVSEITNAPLNRTRPLWEVTFIDGLRDGRIAFCAKVHHAVADGATAVAQMINVVDAPTEEPPPSEDAPPWRPDSAPTDLQMLRASLRAIVRNIMLFPVLLWRTIRGWLAVRRRRRAGRDRPSKLFIRRTSFNKALTRERSFAMLTLPLDEMKQIRRAADVTLNDVVLAVCGGALRRYLAERGEPIDEGLVASVPISTGQEARRRLQGNEVSSVFSSIGVEIADPRARLAEIHRLMEAAKDELQTRGADMDDWSELYPPRLYAWIIRAYSRLRVANLHTPPINLVVSNVPGPREPLHIAGGCIDDIFSVGPILEGIGLNITVWSYVDHMNFSILACPQHGTDVWRIAAHIQSAFDELAQTTGANVDTSEPAPVEAVRD